MGLTSGFGVTGNYLKGKDFEEGKIVKIVRSPEVVPANEGFGFKDGELKGKQIRFYFEVEGEEKTFDTNSKRFLAAMDAFKVGDIVEVRRSGTSTNTQWTAKAATDKQF